jgi:hypothetical protein
MLDSTPRVAELPSVAPRLRSAGLSCHVLDGDLLLTVTTLTALLNDPDG